MMDSFIHHRVFFVGDAAHQVSPFGARGANGAIQSVDNLAWKLARVLKGEASPRLLETYNTERQHGAKENLLNSARATDFITPKSRISQLFRNTVLELAEQYPFARTLVNSGRLSQPCHYHESPLNSADDPGFPNDLSPGSPAKDAPVKRDGIEAWLLNQLGNRFVLMIDGRVDSARCQSLVVELSELLASHTELDLVIIGPSPNFFSQLPRCRLLEDSNGLVSERYGLTGDGGYLLRPDQHVAARWKKFTAASVNDALDRALGKHLTADNNIKGNCHVTA
jgi:3-(3-hydroxy-phenyl)propionate hydroxylase